MLRKSPSKPMLGLQSEKDGLFGKGYFLYYQRGNEFSVRPKQSFIWNKIIDHVLHFMPVMNFVIHAWKSTREDKNVGENNVYEFHCTYIYLLLRVVLSVTVLIVDASFSFTFNNGKEMHVHTTFIRETVCCCHWLTCCMFCESILFHSSVQDNGHNQHLKCI